MLKLRWIIAPAKFITIITGLILIFLYGLDLFCKDGLFFFSTLQNFYYMQNINMKPTASLVSSNNISKVSSNGVQILYNLT